MSKALINNSDLEENTMLLFTAGRFYKDIILMFEKIGLESVLQETIYMHWPLLKFKSEEDMSLAKLSGLIKEIDDFKAINLGIFLKDLKTYELTHRAREILEQIIEN